MDLILKEDVKHLGFKDDIVSVKPGYGRNFLMPTKKAILATESARKVLAEDLKQKGAKEAQLIADVTKIAEKLKIEIVQVAAKVGDNGKIFGSVNALQLVDAIEKQAGHKVESKFVKVYGEPIKTIGTHKADIRLHRTVNVSINFEVVAE
jgi:large subunit ribosomal protein L9